MGEPTDCTDEGLILNGDFNSDKYWEIDNLWVIRNNQAEVEWPGHVADINIFQRVNLVFGTTYIVDFTITEANAPGGSGVRVRLGGAAGPASNTRRIVGDYRFTLTYNGAGSWLVFFISNSGDGAGNLSIDNVRFSSLESYIACAFNMMNLGGTQREWYDLGGGIYMVTYANRDGKSGMWFKFDINAWP